MHKIDGWSTVIPHIPHISYDHRMAGTSYEHHKAGTDDINIYTNESIQRKLGLKQINCI